MRILFVCLGNICRSPMAEGIFRNRLKEAGIDAELDSCGTAGHHSNESPDKRAIKCAASHGVDISMLRARRFQLNDLDAFDLIFTMDRSNHSNILGQTKNDTQRDKVKLLLEHFGRSALSEVPDPWYGDMSDFEQVFAMLDNAAIDFVSSLRK